MNEVIRQLHERKSVRAFEDRPISAGDRLAILNAAAAAPSAGNQQLYTILDITDQAIKDRLAEICDHQPFIAKGKLVLIFLADSRKWYDGFVEAGCDARRPGPGNLMLAVSDACIAAQNAVTAAWSLGIGSCYIGDVFEHCELHREMFGLPEYLFPACMLVFGYPTKQQQERTKPQRLDLKHIVHENAYRPMDGDELREMLTPRAGVKGYDAWMRSVCELKHNSDFAVEMSRSAGEYWKDYL